MKRMGALAILAACGALAAGYPARAEMVLSQVIVDFADPAQSHDEIEIFNSGEERLYVLVEPSRILDAGTPEEQRVAITDPEAAGLIVSPRRLILEPGERRVVRVAVLGPPPALDHVYRVAIKPVVGAVTADTSALKVLVGYDALVIRRPASVVGEIKSDRLPNKLLVENATNTAREFYDGTQCDAAGENCVALPATRLYPNAKWEIELPYDTQATFKTAWGKNSGTAVF